MKLKLSFLIIFFSFFSAFPLVADELEEARNLVASGDYRRAQNLLNSMTEENSSLALNAVYQYLMGVCLYEDGEYDESQNLLESAKAKGQGAANLYLGKLAFLDYDFERAQQLYDAYITFRKKSKLPPDEEVESAIEKLDLAENALERVEQIIVIDSLALPKASFFEYYNLPSSAGRLISASDLPFKTGRSAGIAFVDEEMTYSLWSEPDSDGYQRLMESRKLTSGEWMEPKALSDELQDGGDAAYPFMSGDGSTLYYASDGDNSFGGYDIFISKRDGTDFLQPLNVGMPFNSPYDDYLMAIDEENGIGWWATDRNRLGDKLTVYVYVLNDIRKNYDTDEEDIIDLAMISDYKATQKANVVKYKNILNKLSTGKSINTQERDDFSFNIGNGKLISNLDQFTNPEARLLMKDYLEKQNEIESLESRLKNLQIRYNEGRSENVKTEIAAIEKKLESLRKEKKSLENDIRSLERK